MKKKIMAFWGYPEPELIKKYKTGCDFDWVDLDVDFGYPDTKILPEAYCKIIKNIVNNAFFLKNNIYKILAPIGKEKCDSGWFASALLKNFGFDVETCIYEDLAVKNEPVVCESDLPLRKKFEMITDGIVNPCDKRKIVKSVSKFGFWGVPPNDLGILELFPDETHVFGWTRCVEAGCPANLELEMFVNPDIPTVFYSQSFCSKAQIAKYLANKYNGLYIDVDDFATKSTKAKIEAFIQLR
jgi:hypothetical protein